MTFNINNQTAGIINNVSGDQRIDGEQHGTVIGIDEARRAAGQLREVVGSLSFPAQTGDEARSRASEIESELTTDDPDRFRIADALDQVTRILKSAGSLAAAGAAALGPIQTLAAWLGEIGQPILHILT